jgi:Cys-rich protein (TIGR01571 family)
MLQCNDRHILERSGGPIAYFCSCLLGCYGSAYNRTKIREKHEIRGSYLVDCVMYACCLGVCAVVQEYQEVKLRQTKGMSIGVKA